jgi:hypothetical protein
VGRTPGPTSIVAAPAFSKVTPSRTSMAPEAPLFRASVAPAAMSSWPKPVTVPPTQVIEFSTVNVPAVLNVAPWSVRLPETAEVVAIAREPAVRSSAA